MDLTSAAGGGRRATGPRGPGHRIVSLLLGLIPAAVVVLFWYAGLIWGPEYIRRFLPWPGEAAVGFWELLISGELLGHAGTSIMRVFIGVGLAALVGIPTGVIIAVSRLGEQILGPMFEFLRPIPIAAWVPLSIMLFGIGEVPARALIFLGALYPIVLNTAHGVRYVDPLHLRAAAMLGARSLQVVLRVMVPSALPSILTGVRLALGIGWWVVILAELLAVRSGIGYMMVEAQQLWETEVMIAGMVVIGVIGVLMNRLASAVERRLLRWREG